jgi:hypothetical protein
MSDGKTRNDVVMMIRQHPDKFLQTTCVFPGVNKFVDRVDVSENFDAIKKSAANIISRLCVTDVGVVNKEAIQKELASFNRESQCAKEYVAPPNDVLCKGYNCTLCEKFTSIFQEMKTTGKTKSAIVIKRACLYHLSNEFHDNHLTSCVGEWLFMKKDNGATNYPLVWAEPKSVARSYFFTFRN